MKKLLSGLMCALLCLSCLTPAAAKTSEFEVSLASQLKSLGLLEGVGGGDGTSFDLERAPSRTEALVMLLRALGHGAEAASSAKTHPYSDVPAWADGYVSYAYEHGLTNGVSATAFGAEEDASCAMYLTFMLRALGYAEGPDFTWDSPLALAARCGILPVGVRRDGFLREDVVKVTCAALFARQKDTQKALWERLAAEGVFTPEQFQSAFPINPFLNDWERYENYAAAIEAKTTAIYSETSQLESEQYTVLLFTQGGTPSGTVVTLLLVCKDGAAPGGGTLIRLPLPDEDGRNLSHTPPDELRLSEDGMTLYYSRSYDTALILNEGSPEARVIHEAGTYSYTTDLFTGVTALEMLKAA